MYISSVLPIWVGKENLITITVRSVGAYKKSNFVSHVLSSSRNDKQEQEPHYRIRTTTTTKKTKSHNQDGEWNNETEGNGFVLWAPNARKGKRKKKIRFDCVQSVPRNEKKRGEIETIN